MVQRYHDGMPMKSTAEQTIKLLDIHSVKSKWYKDIMTDWQPDQNYIEFIKKSIENKEYIAPIVVVHETPVYYIVNGHHRYYAHLVSGLDKIKCIVINGTFDESEPLRKAEVLLKKYDQKTGYRYQFSGYLDRWAADAEKHSFINKYRPIYRLGVRSILKKIFKR